MSSLRSSLGKFACRPSIEDIHLVDRLHHSTAGPPSRSTPNVKSDSSRLNDLECSPTVSSDDTPSRNNREKSSFPTYRAWRILFTQEIARDWFLEAQLMLLTVSTGIQDANTFGTYQVFATKQTGNTLFLALYALSRSSLAPKAEQSVGVSIAAFILGGAFFGHIARCVRQRSRAWLLATNIFQTLLVFCAAAIRYWAPRTRVGGPALGVLTLLSFASSGQIAMAVGVGLAELNTTMITGSLVQLSADPSLLKLDNKPRTRRILFYVSLLGGCFVGAAAARRDAALGFLLTAVVKALVSLSFLFNHGIVEEEVRDQEAGVCTQGSGIATPVSKILWGD